MKGRDIMHQTLDKGDLNILRSPRYGAKSTKTNTHVTTTLNVIG